MGNFWYLFAAYTIIWIALWAYTLLVGKRQTRLSDELESLKVLLSEKKDSDSD